MANETPALVCSLGITRKNITNATEITTRKTTTTPASTKKLQPALPAQLEFSAFPFEGKAEIAKFCILKNRSTTNQF